MKSTEPPVQYSAMVDQIFSDSKERPEKLGIRFCRAPARPYASPDFFSSLRRMPRMRKAMNSATAVSVIMLPL